MFTVNVNGKEHQAKVTFMTAHLYELEFRSDMIQDLFGVQTNDGAIEYTVDGSGEDAEVTITKIDYTKISWSAVSKALWAAIKTAEKSTPSYTEWLEDAEGVDLWGVQSKLGDEVNDCFFRSRAAEKEVAEEK